MARSPTIGIKDVENARTELLSHGRTVNAYQIRSILGAGSYSTINKYLAVVEAGDLAGDEDNEAGDENQLVATLAELVRPLAASLIEQNNARLDLSEKSSRKAIDELQDRFRQLQDALDSKCDELDHANGELAEARDRIVAVEETVAELIAKAGSDNEIIKQKTNSELLYKSRFEDAEQRLLAVREDNKVMVTQLLDKVSALQLSIDAKNLEIIDKSDQVTSLLALDKQKQADADNHRVEMTALNTELDAVVEKNASLTQEIDVYTKRTLAIVESHTAERQRYDELMNQQNEERAQQILMIAKLKQDKKKTTEQQELFKVTDDLKEQYHEVMAEKSEMQKEIEVLLKKVGVDQDHIVNKPQSQGDWVDKN